MNGFKSVFYKTCVFKKTFEDPTALSVVGYTRTGVTRGTAIPVKFYSANGENFVYCTDEVLYKTENGALTSTGFSSTGAPLVVPIISGGESATLFVGSGGAKIGETTVSGIPFGKSCAFAGGRLFVADGNKIKYSEEFDFTDFTVGLGFGGFVQTESEDGEVLFLAEDGGRIYAVCKHAVYAVLPYGDGFDFVKEKVSAFYLDVSEKTPCKIGNRVCFISGGRICVLTDGKVKTAGKALDGICVASAGYAGAKNGVYILPVTAGEREYAYYYDTVSGEDGLYETDGFTAACEYAVTASDVYLYKVDVERKAFSAADYSGEYDFGTCRKKAVCRVETHIRGHADITVSGSGSYRATLTEKCNAASCFVHGRSFRIAFENASADFKLYRIAVQYIVYGD